MKDLIIAGTNSTPEVEISKDRAIFRIKGNASLKECSAFYQQLISWLSEYAESGLGSTHFDVQLNNISQPSLKCLLFMFREVKAIQLNGGKVKVSWYFNSNDEITKEVGQDLSYMTELNFTFVEVEPTIKQESELQLA